MLPILIIAASKCSSLLTDLYLDHSYEVEVPARTLNSVLDGISNLPQIDFFSLDVEGFELNVLKGMNLSKYGPTFLLVEARYYDEIDEYLSENQYKMIEKMSFHDYLFRDERVSR